MPVLVAQAGIAEAAGWVLFGFLCLGILLFAGLSGAAVFFRSRTTATVSLIVNIFVFVAVILLFNSRLLRLPEADENLDWQGNILRRTLIWRLSISVGAGAAAVWILRRHSPPTELPTSDEK
jgi:hypothetical protein